MAALFSNVFKLFENIQGCVVVVGDDDCLTGMFLKSEAIPGKHFYQLQHQPNQHHLQIIKQEQQMTVVEFNLHDASVLKQFLRYLASMQHRIELLVVQPSFAVIDDSRLLSEFEIQKYWQNIGLNAVNLSQGIINSMLKYKQGTVIFLGQSPTLFLKRRSLLQLSLFASVRALTQSLAREFQPKGIHIVYLMLPEWKPTQPNLLESVVKVCKHLYYQPHSTWSYELSLEN